MGSLNKYDHLVEENATMNVSPQDVSQKHQQTDLKLLSECLELKLNQIGITPYHYRLLLICGIAHMADAAEIMGISFVIPESSGMASDLRITGTSFTAHISSVLFLGMLIGGCVFGSLGDTFGRRKVLIYSMSVNFISGILSALVPNKYLLVGARFFSGVGAGGAIPLTFTYFVEFFGVNSREKYVIYLAMFWCFGAAFVSLMGYVALPLDREFGLIARWRVFLMLISLPAMITTFCLLFFADNSPKFLLKKNKRAILLKVVCHIKGCAVEWEELSGVFSCGIDDDPTSCEDVVISYVEKTSVCARIREWLINVKSLYSKEHLRDSVGLGLVWFSLSFSFYGWLTYQPSYAANSIGEGIYLECLMGAGAQMLGSVFTLLLISKLHTGPMIGISCFLSGVVMILFPLSSTYGNIEEYSYYVLWAVLSFVSVISWEALNIMQTEAFKTNLRGTAFGLNAMIGRIGSMIGTEVFGMFENGRSLPIIISAISFLVAALLSRLPHSKKGKAIH